MAKKINASRVIKTIILYAFVLAVVTFVAYLAIEAQKEYDKPSESSSAYISELIA